MTGSGRHRCGRCGKARTVKADFPEGPICSNCFVIATSTTGPCPGCGIDRLLVGRDDTGRAACRDCTGITRSFRCERCGGEGEIYRTGSCLRCCVRDDLADLLSVDGHLTKPQQALVEQLVTVPRPRASATWLRKPSVKQLMRAFACASEPITHATLDDLGHVGHAGHLRHQLVACGVLPPRNEYLHRLQEHYRTQLDSVANHRDRRTAQAYVTWHRMRPLQRRDPATIEQRDVAKTRQEVTVIAQFLNWLHSDGHELADCDQGVIDHWLVTGTSTRTLIRSFVQWCSARHHTATPCAVPRGSATPPPTMNDTERIALLRELLDPTPDRQLPHRLAGVLLLVYGVPFHAIQHLSLDDVHHDGDELWLRLADHDVLVPAPVAHMIEAQAHRLGTSSRWLFPGRHHDKPLTRSQLMNVTRRLGIHLRGGRNAALRSLLEAIPATVLAELLGYHPQTMERHAAQTGRTWVTYASYRRSPPASTVTCRG